MARQVRAHVPTLDWPLNTLLSEWVPRQSTGGPLERAPRCLSGLALEIPHDRRAAPWRPFRAGAGHRDAGDNGATAPWAGDKDSRHVIRDRADPVCPEGGGRGELMRERRQEP